MIKVKQTYRIAIALLAVVLIGALGAVGYYYRITPADISTTQAFAKLTTAYQAYTITSATRDCFIGSPECSASALPSLDTVLTPTNQVAIAKAYVVTKGDPHLIGLETIAWYNRYGIETTMITYQTAASVKPTDWFWEVGDCDTNEHLFINALTGQTGPLSHDYLCARAA